MDGDIEDIQKQETIDLVFFHDRARLTIEVLVVNMVLPEVVNKVFFEYYREVTVQNVTKLLLRGA
jgi:hypothetical protein